MATKLTEIEKKDIHCYRGTSSGTTVYMKNGDVIYLTEDFETVDDYFDILTPPDQTFPVNQ